MSKKLLSRVAFGIIYIASAKSCSARGAIHQPACMDSCLAISHIHLGCLPSRSISSGCSIKSYWRYGIMVAYGILSNINDGATL